MTTPTRLALGLGAVAACLRLPLALTTPFWQDEVASARIIGQPTFGDALHQVVRTESTPPLWYVLAWLLHRLGTPLYELRLLSVVEDGLLITLVVVFAARVLSLRFALLAGALVAVGSEFSAEGRWIRAYELSALLTLVLVLALLRAAARPTAGRLAVLALAVAAGSLSHYFFLFTIVAAVLWTIVEPSARAARGRLLAAEAVGLVPFALWSPWFVTQFRHDRYSWIGSFDWREVLSTPLRLFTPDGSGSVLVAGGCLTVAVCAAGSVILWRRSPVGRAVVLCAVTPLAVAALVWAAGVRVYAVRNLIGAGPFLAIAAAAALAALPSRVRVTVPAAVLLAATASFAWAQHLPGPAYDRIAHALVADGWRPGDAVAVFGNRAEFRSPLEWYLPGRPRLSNLAATRIDEPLFVVGGRSLTVGRLPARRLRLERPLLEDAAIFATSRAPSRA